MSGNIKFIATKLSRYPGLKRFVKFTYQSVMFTFKFHRNRYHSKFKIERITGEGGGFFGYYDKCPESPDGKHVIFHAFQDDDKDSTASEVTIVLLELDSGKYENIFKTSAFNLQIGSRLQWIDKDNFIFNIYDFSVSDYASLIYTLSSKQFRKLIHPVFDVSGGKFLSINFNNLASVGSEYGYEDGYSIHKNNSAFIKYGYIHEGNASEITNLKSMEELFPHIFINASGHHFNHLMFSPSATKFIFIFRWISVEGKKEFLVMYDFGSAKLTVLNSEMTSHCCWIDEVTVFGYMSYLGQPGYYYLDVVNGKFTRMIADENLADGHPSVKNGLVLIDSYPNNARMQQLMILSKNKVLLVGDFYSPLIYLEKNRCDLHPRFNQKGDSIYIDSKHEGKRHLYRIKISSDG